MTGMGRDDLKYTATSLSAPVLTLNARRLHAVRAAARRRQGAFQPPPTAVATGVLRRAASWNRKVNVTLSVQMKNRGGGGPALYLFRIASWRVEHRTAPRGCRKLQLPRSAIALNIYSNCIFSDRGKWPALALDRPKVRRRPRRGSRRRVLRHLQSFCLIFVTPDELGRLAASDLAIRRRSPPK